MLCDQGHLKKWLRNKGGVTCDRCHHTLTYSIQQAFGLVVADHVIDQDTGVEKYYSP